VPDFGQETLSSIDMLLRAQCATIKGHRFRPQATYAIPRIKPMRPTMTDLSDRSCECLNPKRAA